MARIEAVRVAQDAAYAASLTDADWRTLSADPEWQQLVAEQSEMVANVMATHGDKLGYAGDPVASATPAAPSGAFKVIGSDIARMQGIGIVTNLGQYTENMRMPGMLFMRTLRSRYPHAKITSIDTSKAEKLPGVRKILHRGNLPDEYKDVFLGAANPTRFLFNEEVFEVGSPIAAIAADSEHIADEAMRQIDVQYTVLPAALDFLEALKIPQNKIRVVQPGYVGSGYGYRSGIDLAEVHAAILSKLTARPIKMNYTRYEDFVTRTHRNEFRDEMKMGVNKDGSIAFGQFKVIANVGAQRAGAANGAWFNMQNLYNIPNLRLEAIDVMTNSFKSGPYRCVSHPNGTFALELTMEKAAYAIGMDPVAFRLKNLNEVGNPDTKAPFSNPGIRDCITAVRDALNWSAKWHAPKANQVRPGVYHGIGLAAHACSHGAGGNPASGQVIINSDGTVQAVSATNDIGDGQRSLLMMIVAEALGVPLTSVTTTPFVDTDLTTDNSGTFGSQQTNTGGRGQFEAATDARKQALDWGARKFNDDAKKAGQTTSFAAADMDLVDGKVFVKANPGKTLGLADVMAFKTSGPIVGRADYVQDPKWQRTAWAAHGAEVEVDTVLGSIKITRYVAAHDLGKALNPFAVQQQIEGGVVMATASALTEELLIDKATGLPLNPNLLDYKPLSIKDAPLAEVIIIEKAKEYGVFGAHGIGEPPMALPAPVIAIAVYNAVGVWVSDMPLTREKLLTALKAG